MDTVFGSKKRYTAPRPRVPEHLEFFSSSSLRVARASTQRRAMSHNDHSLLTTGCASASCFFFLLLLLLLAHYSRINRTLSNENQLITTFAALLTLAGGARAGDPPGTDFAEREDDDAQLVCPALIPV